MKKISEIIIEIGLEEREANRFRETVRGIILNETKVLLGYSSKFDDYIIPGGGIKKDEDHKLALERELKEELGAINPVIKDYLGYIEEKKYGVRNTKTVYIQKSHFYICDVLEFGEQNLQGEEIEQEFKPVWIEIIDAINHNENAMSNEIHDTDGIRTVLKRENNALRSILEAIKNEKI